MIAVVVVVPAFDLGRLVATPGALALVDDDPSKFFPFIERHACGDGGDLCDEDKLANAQAIEHGNRVLSAYEIHGTKFWIITEADRSATTILLPEDY